MFHSIRIESFRFCIFSYIIFSLGNMGWPALCYCAEGHLESVHAIIGCFDDTGVNPNHMDDSLYRCVNDKHGIESCDSCSDVVISIHVYRNQPLSARSIVQTGKANYPVFFPFIPVFSGMYHGEYAFTRPDRFNRLYSTLRSVRLLI